MRAPLKLMVEFAGRHEDREFRQAAAEVRVEAEILVRREQGLPELRAVEPDPVRPLQAGERACLRANEHVVDALALLIQLFALDERDARERLRMDVLRERAGAGRRSGTAPSRRRLLRPSDARARVNEERSSQADNGPPPTANSLQTSL